MKVLCICQRANTRSHALAYLLKDEYQHDAVAIGWHSAGPELMRTLCAWAELIVVMETNMRDKVPAEFHEKLTVCDVGPDVWFRRPSADLLDKCDAWISNNKDKLNPPAAAAPELPFVSCLCPTFRSPDTLEVVIECFLRQTYPADRRELLILDDAQEITEQSGDGWRLYSRPRMGSLSEKYNWLATMARGDVFATWEHDDWYAETHLARHVAALGDWRQPVLAKDIKVWSDYHGKPAVLEGAAGRFHGSLVFTRSLFTAVGGWPNTANRDFDQQLIRQLQEKAARVVVPAGCPSYVYRWHGSNQPHAQHFMHGEDPAAWWTEAAEKMPPAPRDVLVPQMDANAKMLCKHFGQSVGR